MPISQSNPYSRLSIDDTYHRSSSSTTTTITDLKNGITINNILSIIYRLKYILIILIISIFLFKSMIETHIEIAFYKKGWISELLPPDPPPLSSQCFSPTYLNKTYEPIQESFPSSPKYNLTLGNLGLSPKVLSISPGFDLPHHDDCYRFAKSLPPKPIPSMIQASDPKHYHLYWRSDLSPITDRQIITLQSLLSTQDFTPLPSDPTKPKSHLILWTNPSTRSLRNDPLLAPFLLRHSSKLSLRLIDLTHLTFQTPMESHPILNSIFDKRAWLDGDLIRVLVLWKFGGFWVDMDNLVLKDLNILGEHEWVVMWDCYDKPYEPLNGHIMHFQPQSPYLCEMMSQMATGTPPRPASTDWGQHLYYKVYRSLISSSVTPFKVLPFCLTDGRSCTLRDRLPDPFATPQEESRWKWSQKRWAQVEERLKGVFSIHLHNQWEKRFPKHGWIQRMYVERWQKELIGS